MSENSFIAILNRMKSRITTEADRREGTWTADNLQAVANELARVYAEDIEDIIEFDPDALSAGICCYGGWEESGQRLQ